MHLFFTHCANSIISSQNIDQKLIFVLKKSSWIFKKDKMYQVGKSVGIHNIYCQIDYSSFTVFFKFVHCYYIVNFLLNLFCLII